MYHSYLQKPVVFLVSFFSNTLNRNISCSSSYWLVFPMFCDLSCSLYQLVMYVSKLSALDLLKH